LTGTSEETDLCVSEDAIGTVERGGRRKCRKPYQKELRVRTNEGQLRPFKKVKSLKFRVTRVGEASAVTDLKKRTRGRD